MINLSSLLYGKCHKPLYKAFLAVATCHYFLAGADMGKECKGSTCVKSHADKTNTHRHRGKKLLGQ